MNESRTPYAACCFPVHESCWEIFSTVSGTSPDSYPRKHTSVLFKLLGCLPVESGTLMWAHNYGMSSKQSRTISTHPNWQEDPCKIPELDSFFEKPDEWRRLRLETIPTGRAEMPDLFPTLPAELAQRILSYLDVHDLIRLCGMPSKKRIIVPDLIWKGCLEAHADIGCLLPWSDDSPGNLWYPLCVLGARYLNCGFDSILNRQRIWKLCVRLADMIDEILLSEPRNLQLECEYPFLTNVKDSTERWSGLPPGTSEVKFPMLITEVIDPSPATRYSEDPAKIMWRGSIHDFVADEVWVSFVGEGNMQYVCGLTFQPSGQEIGFINKQKRRRASLISDETLAMVIAVNKTGVVDISIGNDDGHHRWVGGGNNLNSASLSLMKRTIEPTGKGMKFSDVCVALDVCRIKRLGIFSSSFKSPDELSLEEVVLQGNLWCPDLPIMGPIATSKKSLNIEAYYDCKPENLYDKEGRLDYLFVSQLPEGLQPMKVLDFGDRLPIRITCWSQGGKSLSGITFLLREDDEDDDIEDDEYVVLGEESGMAIDFPLNAAKGERIKYMEVMADEDGGHILGLAVHTTMSRRLHLTCHSIHSMMNGFNDLLPPLGHRFTGLYGRAGWEPYIVGLAIRYFGEKDEELAGNPKFLGEITFCKPSTTLELDWENGEHFTNLTIWTGIKWSTNRDFCKIPGLVFHTSAGRRLWFGQKPSRKPDENKDDIKHYDLTSKKHLMWELDQNRYCKINLRDDEEFVESKRFYEEFNQILLG
ncbi:hypothetical protein ABW19_dt0208246 [Dactylella cylindrospora]|nr:hypothetical protein ABW19_dt0208246 [Dactylella cylindrospora]